MTAAHPVGDHLIKLRWSADSGFVGVDDLAFARIFNHVIRSASSDEGASISAAHAVLGLGEL
jgi:hypothetical protein